MNGADDTPRDPPHPPHPAPAPLPDWTDRRAWLALAEAAEGTEAKREVVLAWGRRAGGVLYPEGGRSVLLLGGLRDCPAKRELLKQATLACLPAREPAGAVS